MRWGTAQFFIPFPLVPIAWGIQDRLLRLDRPKAGVKYRDDRDERSSIERNWYPEVPLDDAFALEPSPGLR